MSHLLIIFAKQPLAGSVKTRLGEAIGMAQAAELYTAFSDDLFARLHDPEWQRAITYAPANAAAEDHFQQRTCQQDQLWKQPEGNLGERLTECFARGFQQASRIVIIGSDAPTLPTEFINTAFSALEHVDCVLGPAVDGGYYLIGLRRQIPELFADIEWSTSTVLQQTLTQLSAADASLHLLPPWYDVDEVVDLDLLRGHLRAMELAGHFSPAPRTMQWLTSHDA